MFKDKELRETVSELKHQLRNDGVLPPSYAMLDEYPVSAMRVRISSLEKKVEALMELLDVTEEYERHALCKGNKKVTINT